MRTHRTCDQRRVRPWGISDRMATAIGRDALLFGIHPRRLAGVPQVVGTLVSTVGARRPRGGLWATPPRKRQECAETCRFELAPAKGRSHALSATSSRPERLGIRADRHRDRGAHRSSRQVFSNVSPVDHLTKRRLRSAALAVPSVKSSPLLKTSLQSVWSRPIPPLGSAQDQPCCAASG